MMIKTKVVATLGPASWDMPVLRTLVENGADVFRINFSHGTLEQHARCLEHVRRVQQELDQPLAIMADLCGPKIRVGQMQDGSATLQAGHSLILQRDDVSGTADRISTTLPELVDELQPGDRLLLDDGRLELRAVSVDHDDHVVCEVVVGGTLSSGKGVNLPDTNLQLSAMTDKDHRDARWIAERDFDYVALSFVQRPDDIAQLRGILDEHGSTARIVAKIEKPQALAHLDAIIDTADAILVARGDLGVEMPLPDVPLVQKRLAAACERAGKCCIVATQMLETMIHQPSPTRAEVSDVANAVFDRADAVMLSGETAVGKYPSLAVRTMSQITERIEQHFCKLAVDGARDQQCCGSDSDTTAGAIARAVQAIVYSRHPHNQGIRAVVVYTMTGQSALMLAKMRLPVPVLALSPVQRTLQQASMFYGVYASHAGMYEHTREILPCADSQVRRLGWADTGDTIVVVSGRPLGQSGTTNTLVIHTVE